MKNLQAKVDRWNALHAIGTPVTYRRDDGSLVETVTRSEAQVLSGHTPVIWLDNVRGCVSLDRVKACTPDEALKLRGTLRRASVQLDNILYNARNTTVDRDAILRGVKTVKEVVDTAIAADGAAHA